jgi:hypothetical protein
MRQLDDGLFHEDHVPRPDIQYGGSQRLGESKLTPEEQNALAILADAVSCCRAEDMRTAEVFAALDLLARHTPTRWPFEQFKKSLNFAVGDPSHAEGRWQNSFSLRGEQ